MSGDTLPIAQDDDHLWLLNLQGVVAFIDGRQEAAAQHFRGALRRSPTFSPALLNLGILYAQNGRFDKAIGYFQRVVAVDLPRDAPQTYAAAYTEWADALAQLGRPDDADAAFRLATQTDPLYAEAYIRWAAHTADPTRAAELKKTGEAIAKKYGDVYADNLIGKLRDAAARSSIDGSPVLPEGAFGELGMLAEPTGGSGFWHRLYRIWSSL